LVDIGRQALYRLIPPFAGATRTRTRTLPLPPTGGGRETRTGWALIESWVPRSHTAGGHKDHAMPPSTATRFRARLTLSRLRGLVTVAGLETDEGRGRPGG